MATFVRWVSAILVLLVFSTSAQPGENQAQVGADLAFYSKYIWRGMVWDEDPVLQPDLWMTVSRLTMTFWGNMDLTRSNGDFEGQFNEWDTFITADVYSGKIVEVGGGIYYNSFPTSSGSGTSTAEVAGQLTVHVPGSPTIAAYWDIWQLHGVYLNFGFSQELQIGAGTLSTLAACGWGDARHNLWSGVPEAGGWLDAQACVTYSLPVKAWLSLTPGIQYDALLQQRIRNSYRNQGVQWSGLIATLNAAITVNP